MNLWAVVVPGNEYENDAYEYFAESREKATEIAARVSTGTTARIVVEVVPVEPQDVIQPQRWGAEVTSEGSERVNEYGRGQWMERRKCKPWGDAYRNDFMAVGRALSYESADDALAAARRRLAAFVAAEKDIQKSGTAAE